MAYGNCNAYKQLVVVLDRMGSDRGRGVVGDRLTTVRAPRGLSLGGGDEVDSAAGVAGAAARERTLSQKP